MMCPPGHYGPLIPFEVDKKTTFRNPEITLASPWSHNLNIACVRGGKGKIGAHESRASRNEFWVAASTDRIGPFK